MQKYLYISNPFSLKGSEDEGDIGATPHPRIKYPSASLLPTHKATAGRQGRLGQAVNGAGLKIVRVEKKGLNEGIQE
ncbi:MAG: hypothetical protein HYX79_10270 [Chloroflexi bacterium]|nr:hypothetical protein [Chloroflexota bacterium]